MTDYSELVKALRWCSVDEYVPCTGCPMNEETHGTGCFNIMHQRAAAAIEALQAEVQFYDALAEEWQSAAENKERLLGLYRAEQAKHFYSATKDDGRVIQNPCVCMNIPVFPDSSEIPNS